MEGLPDGYTARPATAADVPAIMSVLHARDLLEVGAADSTPGFVEGTFRNPRVDPTLDTRMVFDADGAAVAYADVTAFDDPSIAAIWAQVHPEHQGKGIGTAIFGWAEPRAIAIGTPKIHQLVSAADRAGRALVEAAGYELVRAHLHMRRTLDDLPAEHPVPGVDIRAMRPGEERQVHHVLDASFVDHYALETPPYDEWWEEWQHDPTFDPTLWQVADAGGELVGVSINMIEGVGWIGDIGVLESWRGRGIAKALLARSFRVFAERGQEAVRLNVDSQNETGAVALYEAMGMHEHRRYLMYEKLRDQR